MAVPAGSILKNKAGAIFLVETATKRLFPDSQTLAALTLGISTTGVPTLTDAALEAIPNGPAFPSIAAFVAANPRIAAMVQRVVRSLIPSTSLKDLKGGLMTVAESAAALFADAIANPGNWMPFQSGSKTHPLPNGFSKAASQAINTILNKLLNNLINQALSPAQQSEIDKTVNQVGQEVDGANDGDPISDKDPGDKEGVKESDEKEEGDKEPGDKEPGDKEPGEKEPGEKEPGEKEPGEKEPGEKEPGEKEPGEKEPGEKEPGEKEPGDKDDKDDDGDGDDGDDSLMARIAPAPGSPVLTKTGPSSPVHIRIDVYVDGDHPRLVKIGGVEVSFGGTGTSPVRHEGSSTVRATPALGRGEWDRFKA